MSSWLQIFRVFFDMYFLCQILIFTNFVLNVGISFDFLVITLYLRDAAKKVILFNGRA